MRALDPQDPAITYAAVLDALPIVAYMADPQGVITYVTRGLEHVTGNDARDVIDHGYRILVHPDDLAAVSATWEDARKAETSYRDRFRLRSADGSYRWVLSQADPMRGAAGEIVGWFGTVSDIHDLRLAEDGLAAALAAAASSARDAAERAAFVERLLDASDDCVKVLDLDSHLVSMSANGQRALAIADFAAVEGTDWLGFWFGEDRIAAEAAVAAARAGGRGRFTGRYEVEEREKWWDVTVTPILGGDGRPQQLLAISRDVTEMLLAHRALARSEERYRVLGEALPGVTWTATPDGLIDHVGGPSISNRLPPAARLGEAWLETVHPDEREHVRTRWRASVASGQPYDAQFRVRRADGAYRWQLVRALPQRDADGAILRWVGVNVDIDDQRRSDEAREQFVRLAEASDDFIAIGDTAGNATYVNAAGRRMLEIGSLDDARATHLMNYFLPEDRAFAEVEILPAIEHEGRWTGEFRLRNFRTGEPVPIWYNVFSLHDDAGAPVGVATVSRDIRERQRVEAGLRTLAETGAVMFRSLDYDQTLRNVAEAVTRSFATYCIVDMLDPDATLRRVAAFHSDSGLAVALNRAASARTVFGEHPVARAVREGVSTLVPFIGADWVSETGMHPSSQDDVAALAARSMICVPVRTSTDGTIVGALSFVIDVRDSRGGYTADDLRFAEELAVRVGIAFDHARAYERERRIAVTLQEASLPGVLPALEHLRLSAEYRPGNSEATIGGDWYDSFLLDDGRVAITVGDVLGNGLGAAVTMGKVRQAMQSVAMVLPDANVMLDVADRTVRSQSLDTYATALAGFYDPQRGTFTFASAGHPGPALRHPGGRIEEFASAGVLLGLRASGETTTVTIDVPPGALLVFYTDGLVEATRDIEEGHRRLHAAMADPGVVAAQNPARALVAHVLGGRPATDDIAVLVAEAGPSL